VASRSTRHSSIYKAPAPADLTIGLAVVNDRIADSPREHNSFLLVDNVRLNRDFGQGYQLVDHQADGRFETVVHT
jgi:hypothetical protein